MELVSFVK